MSHTSAGAELVESLVTDERLLAVDAGPLLGKLASVAEGGLTATFYASGDGTGSPLSTVFLTDADTGLKDKAGKPLVPAGANSARLVGYLEVPLPGAYRFYALLEKPGAAAELQFAHLPHPTLTVLEQRPVKQGGTSRDPGPQR